jgi:hypothetical protein
MIRIFVQSRVFSQRMHVIGNDRTLELIEHAILLNPLSGDVIQGCGGVRKFRIANQNIGKGKRGGLRVLFLDLPQRGITYLLYIYGKGDAEDITTEQKKQIMSLVRIIKES